MFNYPGERSLNEDNSPSAAWWQATNERIANETAVPVNEAWDNCLALFNEMRAEWGGRSFTMAEYQEMNPNGPPIRRW